MLPENFLKLYELALATQDWNQVKKLIHPTACITFSDGSRHLGKEAIQQAFERNFSLIKNESYAMTKVQWLLKKKKTALACFNFEWRGILHDKEVSGKGLGNILLRKEEDKWLLVMENLHKLA
ncbi:MAG: nuclear transport factor 2 family protein [Chitinophagales bacterium]|nr:nuclear transport factor 2 family protein [Bacteroidota bacterium]MCB9256149.1 nuclear transport factor 2 family protein [Chitinophagales bacterium]